MVRIHDNGPSIRTIRNHNSYYRKAAGLSQIQLADKIDISRTHMSRIENSDCAVSLDVVFRIARVLDVPVCKLFEFR
ncbi:MULTISPECIES: helix-turn-helix transcriptional regulator [Gemmiger]|uniref:helix-turn-helix transcriptional regulator n=1 Tax=Gemmiger sp. TaxID=2049027 RepID=UPI0030798879